MLEYREVVNPEFLSLLHFPIERNYFIDPSSTPIFRRVVYGLKDYWTVIFQFRSQFKEKKPDLVHLTSSASFGLIRDLVMVHISKRENVKNLVHFRFGRIPELKKKSNWEWYLINALIKRTDGVIVIDTQSYKVLTESGHKNVYFLPNPISVDIFKSIDTHKNLKRKNRTVLFAGHLIKTKGVIELIKACVNIPNIKLKLMGASQNGTEEQLLELAMQKGDVEWIEIMPNQSSSIVIKEMLCSSVFVLPSYTEGFPNVILESMACGCPIVATDVGAIPEMLNCDFVEKAGLCVAPKKVAALQQAIERMLDDKVFAQKCGENARKQVIEKYSMPIVWSQLFSIWMNVLKE